MSYTETVILLIIIVVLVINKIRFENNVNNYPISKVDGLKIAMDNGTPDQIKRNMLSGKYDKK